jgi:hypothetical protein
MDGFMFWRRKLAAAELHQQLSSNEQNKRATPSWNGNHKAFLPMNARIQMCPTGLMPQINHSINGISPNVPKRIN